MIKAVIQASKRRAPNFTNREKIALLNIIQNYKNIIENKQTNATTWHLKTECWENIQMQFNAASEEGIYRDTSSLKKYYENIKKSVRKTVAEEKKEACKTGGGSSCSAGVSDGVTELALEIMNRKTVYGLQNSFDSDNHKSSTAMSSSNKNNLDHTYVEQESDSDDLENQVEITRTTPEATPRQSGRVITPRNSRAAGTEITNRIQSGSVITPRNSRAAGAEITNRVLHVSQPQSEDLRCRFLKRRRPTVQQLPASKLSEEYIAVNKLKKEVFEAEKEAIQIRKAQETEIFELKKRKLELEIELLNKKRN